MLFSSDPAVGTITRNIMGTVHVYRIRFPTYLQTLVSVERISKSGELFNGEERRVIALANQWGTGSFV
jgi:hypothetical protein